MTQSNTNNTSNPSTNNNSNPNTTHDASITPQKTTQAENLSAPEQAVQHEQLHEQPHNQRNKLGHLELLEERAVVNKERLDVGKVIVTKHQRSKTVEVPIELVEEVLTIQTQYYDAESQDLLTGKYDEKDILRHVEPSLDSVAVVNINGKRIEVGSEPVEVVLTRQVATITKETYAVQEIDIEKSVHTHTDSISVELRHEELDVKEEGFLDHKND